MAMNHSRHELEQIGFRKLGDDVLIDQSVRFFNPQYIEIASRVRIDCFCLITASPEGVRIGNNVHIAAGCFIFGSGARVAFEDFSTISSRVSIYTSNDDYVSGALTNPTVPSEFRKVETGRVVLGRYVTIGSGTVILPGAEIGRGASVGALTLVRKSVAEGEVVFGNPIQKLPTRRPLEELEMRERKYLESLDLPIEEDS